MSSPQFSKYHHHHHHSRATPLYYLIVVIFLVILYTVGLIMWIRDYNNNNNLHTNSLSESLSIVHENNSSKLLSWFKRHHVRIDQLYNRYEPPPIPTLFHSFKYSTSLQNSEHDDPNGVPNTQSFFRAFTSLFHSSKVPLQSHYQCVSHKEWNRERQNIPYTSCRFENICINRRGEWILYTNSKHAHAMNNTFWVHTGAYFAISLKIRVERPPTRIVNHQGKVVFSFTGDHASSNNHDEDHDHYWMVLSERFKWVSDPTLVFTRHAMANLGHAWLDNYLPLFNLMMIFEYVRL